jgi:AAA domain
LLTGMSTVPSGIEFETQWPKLDEGGLAQLEAYIKAHPHLRCIIIDTWAKVAPHMKGRSQYEEDYAALSPLKQLADTYHLSILAIHHLRKTQAHDVLDEIMGSTAIIGVVDGILILKRERAEDHASLFITGRDIEQEREIPLCFDQTTGWWHLDDQHDEVDEAFVERAEQGKRRKKE